MTQHRKLILALLCVMAGFMIVSERSPLLPLAKSGSFPSALQSQAKPEQPSLTAAEKRGKAFYLRGDSSSGQEITAMVGEIDVPA